MREIPRLLNNQQNSMEDLIREILLQLPTKSLVRFKCVSKLWLSLISDSNFAKSHFELAAAPSHRFLYMSAFDHEARSLDLDASFHNGSAAVNLVLPLLDSSFSLRDLQILGSCRGFILLSNYPNLILWNPLTGIHKRLSYSPVALEFYLSIYEPMVMYGFGYDASTDDYLIVLAFFEFHDSEADTLTHLEFFSLRTNSWIEIEGTHFPYSIPWVRSGLHFNGAVHWLANRHADDDESDKVIVVFDLIQKSLSEVSLPDCDFEYFFGDLRIMGGCLSLSYWQWGVNKTEIWVMKEYKVQSSWTKYEIPWNCISPIYSTKGGELVAYNHKGRLMKFNDKGQLIERCTFCDDPKGFGVAMYTESLLSLPSDFGEAREDDQQ